MSPRQNLTGAGGRIGLFSAVVCFFLVSSETTALTQHEGSVVTQAHRVHNALISALERQDIQEQLSHMGLSKQDALDKLEQLNSDELKQPSIQSQRGLSLFVSVLGLSLLSALIALLTDRLGLTRIFSIKATPTKSNS